MRITYRSPRFQYNFKQLRLPTLVVLCLISYDLWFISCVETGRGFKDYIEDVRRMNDYCNYYLVFISVLIGLLLTLPYNTEGKPENLIPVAPLAVSLIAASINMVFFPVPYSNDVLWPTQLLWLYHVIFEQTVVIFTAFGLFGILRTFMKRRPVPTDLSED